MSKFSEVLNRLGQAANERQRGLATSSAFVNRADLVELLAQFNRVEAQLRQTENERDALAAQVEAFGTLTHEAINDESAEPIATDGQITGYAVSYEWLEKVGAAIELPPQQHLAEVRAQAVESLLSANLYYSTSHDLVIAVDDIQEHADNIRQGGAA